MDLCLFKMLISFATDLDARLTYSAYNLMNKELRISIPEWIC